MTHHFETERMEDELRQIQDEINRRHRRVDNDYERLRDLYKIDKLRERRSWLRIRLLELGR